MNASDHIDVYLLMQVCGVCAEGYSFSQTTMNCVPCYSRGSLLSFFNLILFIFLSLLFLLATHSAYTFRVNKTVRDLEDYQLYLLMKIGVCSLDDFENNRTTLRLYLMNWRSRFEQICKSYVVLFQLIGISFKCSNLILINSLI